MNQNNNGQENKNENEPEVKIIKIELDVLWFNVIFIPILLGLGFFRGNPFVDFCLFILLTIFFFVNMLIVYILFK